MTATPDQPGRSRAAQASGADSPVRATFDGEPIEAEAGSSVAAAIMQSRGPAWRTTKSGAGRGLFCGIGVCYDCIVEIDGESGQRACMVPLAEGMDVRPADGTRADATAVASRGERHAAGHAALSSIEPLSAESGTIASPSDQPDDREGKA